MNKEKFLKQLEQKLKVLSKDEIQDILNEYEDIIDEKVKHGKTEEEAVREFGDVSSLSKEILESYKINPEYQKSSNEFIDDCEQLIKRGAKKLTEVTEEVVNTFKKSENEITLETVFEIILKVCFVLLVIAVIHLPFWIIGEIGESFFQSDFIFFGNLTIFNHNIFAFLWKGLTEIAYVIVCILLVVAVFKKYTVSKVDATDKKARVVENKNENKKKKVKKVVQREKKENEKKVEKKNNNTLSNLLIIILKIWIAIIFIFPLLMIQFGILIAICVMIYLMIKNAPMYALLVLLVGVSLFVGHLIHILSQALFTKQRIHFWPFVPSFLMIILGGIFTVDYFLSFTYSDNLEELGYTLKTEEYEYVLKDKIEINYDEIVINEELRDDEIIVEVTYYDKFVNVRVNEHEMTSCTDEKCEIIDALYFSTKLKEKKSINDIIDDTLLQNIRDKKIVNYGDLGEVHVKVITNENNSGRIY